MRAGLTATSVCSLTAEPPRLLACVHRDADAHGLILESGYFAVNVLTREQQDLAEHFGGRDSSHGPTRFGLGTGSIGRTGIPVLVDAAAVFECRLVEALPPAPIRSSSARSRPRGRGERRGWSTTTANIAGCNGSRDIEEASMARGPQSAAKTGRYVQRCAEASAWATTIWLPTGRPSNGGDDDLQAIHDMKPFLLAAGIFCSLTIT